MSEKLVLPPQETQIPNPQQHLGPETGAINFGELANRGKEFVQDVGDVSKIALFGIRASIANVRMKRAGNTMAEMDYKVALQTDAMNNAYGNNEPPAPTITGTPARPRNRKERMADMMFDKKLQKQLDAEAYAYRAQKIYGHKDHLPGMNKTERKVARREIRRDHSLNASEKRMAKLKVNAAPVKYGDLRHKQVARASEKIDNTINRITKRPVARQRRAVGTIQEQHAMREKHLAKAAEVRREVRARRHARKAARATTP